METKKIEEEEEVANTTKEKEYRFSIYDDATDTTEEVTLKESQLSDEHHKAMFMDMWEYFESSSTIAQQLFVLKLQTEQPKRSTGQINSTRDAYKKEIKGVKM